MNKKTSFLLLLLVLSHFASTAQSTKSKWHFKSTNLIGYILGEQGSKFSMQSINGFTKNNWMMGIGVGIDPYGYSSIPVFLDIRKSMGKKAWQPFVYADGGPSFPLPNPDLPKTWSSGIPAFDLNTGWVAEFGIGLQKKIAGSTQFVMQFGYSQKYYSFVNHNNNFVFIGGTWPETTTYEYQYRRWAFRMGITL
ncbi:MAG: hypothetical protein CFE25_17950 [Chitinophagaceae bacterium BSSC1]|nr:MAG: hypothetical protein CFE25_17950 [Chitinophagaceae bacterium BSSC1]